MKQQLFTFLGLLLCILGHTQTHTGKLENPLKNMPEMDIVLWPMGMDSAVNIGKLTANGTLEFNFPEKEAFQSADTENQMVADDFKYALRFNCIGQDEPEYPIVMATSISPISLWHKNRYVGVLFPVTDERLMHWMEDEAYNNPIEGTFYEIVYVAEATTLKTECATTFQFSEETVNASYHYQLELEAGLNVIAYTIEDIHKMNSKVTSNKPSKVVVKNVQAEDGIKWIAKYF
ncbi:hypothetical protein D778_00466 [Xanthomarina gelatinilytica]|uniref:Uncharacterized protein n=1 Tax=Xanthomarina gelatinilytica TaxID=1137281 RepID=M7N7R1_9FLAO|nr:hypothetical protein [Xanthomarina gelatinilytica]EMQ94513.1 hypothetical protein D778_00466 [Xanthomarina gelatinilytica]